MVRVLSISELLYVLYSSTPLSVWFVGQLHLCPMTGNDFIFSLFNFLLLCCVRCKPQSVTFIMSSVFEFETLPYTVF